ncbi:NfeD family protein [Nocardioides sp. SYSU D00038]|uniref:NfeD family protein n=1 Tax=Nocardioides sp. SYSU D00038 TaxID=2812554 RepID=UPI001967FCF6|nr:NfeD family protein [Nocardioides sp. SYSU D00038]
MDWFRDHLWETWLGVGIVLGIAEMFSLDLFLAMLAFGALVGMLAALLGLPFVVQALLAAGAAVATLGLVRPRLVQRLHQGPELALGHGKLVGQQGVVTERITGLDVGRVRLAGEIWSAAPYDSTLVIEPGETVEVLQIRGATAYVHPIPSLEA